MSAWDPAIEILATAEWSGKTHPMAWVKPYGKGRVFYTTLGPHGRHLPAPRHAEAHDPGRALGGVGLTGARLIHPGGVHGRRLLYLESRLTPDRRDQASRRNGPAAEAPRRPGREE